MTERDDVPTALAGTRVVDLTRGAAGPIVAMTLADYGADVLKIEPVTGDYGRIWAGFEIWNRGKRCVALDLSSAAGMAVLGEVLTSADVVVEDARPGSRLSAAITKAAEAVGILHCRLSAFGPAENGDPRPGDEAVVSAAAGLYLGINELAGASARTPRDRPIFTVAPTNSFAAAHLATQAILAGLVASSRGRAVRHVETSLLQGGLASLMRRRFARVDASTGRAPAPARTETVQRGIALTFLTVECSDGRWLQMCARQDAHFLSWLRAIGLKDALDDARYASGPMTIPSVADITELEMRIRTAMRRRSASEWLRIFAASGVGADEFLSPAEFLERPNTVANDLVTTWADTGEKTLSPIAQLSATPAQQPRHLTRSAPQWVGSSSRMPVRPHADPSTSRSDGPLSGLVILEVAYFIAAPLATTLLAELGARVIKVEPPRGDPYRRTGVEIAHLLHGKESIGLDLKQPEGLEILHRLIGRADALIQSFRPGVADRLGFGYDQCRELNPRLVYLLATGYGSRGPLARQPAFHSTPNAWSGGGILQGGQGNPPVDCSYPDTASAIVNATALLLGLCARERIGAGQYIETCMLLTGAQVLSNWYGAEATRDFRPQDSLQRGLGAGYRLYQCRDGWIFLSAPSPHAWNALAAALSRPDWSLDAKPSTWSALMDATAPYQAELEALFAERPVDEVVAGLASPRFAVVRADAETLEEYLERRELLTPASHADFGDYWKLPAKFIIDGQRPTLGEAPRAGEHTLDIAAELGLDDGTVAALVERGVLGLPAVAGHTAGSPSRAG
jgi:crotonobetainyl-CoA:carnitine CoA-transferase CaiB-like acyl-CoA transferase